MVVSGGAFAVGGGVTSTGAVGVVGRRVVVGWSVNAQSAASVAGQGLPRRSGPRPPVGGFGPWWPGGQPDTVPLPGGGVVVVA